MDTSNKRIIGLITKQLKKYISRYAYYNIYLHSSFTLPQVYTPQIARRSTNHPFTIIITYKYIISLEIPRDLIEGSKELLLLSLR